jgi:hypothetical protein
MGTDPPEDRRVRGLRHRPPAPRVVSAGRTGRSDRPGWSASGLPLMLVRGKGEPTAVGSRPSRVRRALQKGLRDGNRQACSGTRIAGLRMERIGRCDLRSPTSPLGWMGIASGPVYVFPQGTTDLEPVGWHHASHGSHASDRAVISQPSSFPRICAKRATERRGDEHRQRSDRGTREARSRERSFGSIPSRAEVRRGRMLHDPLDLQRCRAVLAARPRGASAPTDVLARICIPHARLRGPHREARRACASTRDEFEWAAVQP